MTYAIIGSGAIGTALARQFARKNIPVRVANSRGPASIAPLSAELGSAIEPATLEEALTRRHGHPRRAVRRGRRNRRRGR